MASNSNDQPGASKGASVAVSASTYGAIKPSTSDMWMIRLPNRLATAWEDASEGTVLGTLTFTKGGANSGGPPSKRPKISAPASSSKISITIDQNLAESQSDLPLNYTLEAMTKKTPGVFHPFTRNDNGSVSIHGTVSRTASAQVAGGAPTSTSDGAPADANNSRYRTLLRNRLLDTAVNSKRFVQPGGTDASGHGASAAATAAASLGTGFGGSVARYGKRIMDAQERGMSSVAAFGTASGPPITSAEGIRTTLFELFSKKQIWTVKELRLASGGRLPERELREALKDIAEYHRSGEHKNMWELKAEFRSAVTASSSGGGDQAQQNSNQ